MTSENIGRGPTIEVAAFIDSIRTALEGYATWARESAAAIAGHLRGDAGPHYPAVEQFSRLHRGAHAPRPLATFIPAAYGGRGQITAESLSVLEELSYTSLPLSLIAGINGALFLQPVSRYGTPELQQQVFSRVLNDGALGGLMITEPDFGSDALNMQTSFVPEGDGFRIRGTKHWAGLTGHADFWLLTTREQAEDGRLGRNINFFVWDKSRGGIAVDEYFHSLGLEEIPYGRNRIDTHVPAGNRLQPLASGVRMLLDVLHRSRLQFPGMAMGFLRRILDEAWAHVRRRHVGGRPLHTYDQVQDRLAEIESAYTACSAMCAYTSREASIDRDCSGMALQANAIKTVVTDMMQEASQSLLQLVGAKGYRRDSYAGRATVDCRPFQIFEGSNDILYEQIADAVLKGMKRAKASSLALYLKTQELTTRVADRVRHAFDVAPGTDLPQRDRVELGRALGRVITMQMVEEARDTGFDGGLVETAMATLSRSISRTMGGVQLTGSSGGLITPAEDYRAAGHWRSMVTPAG